MTAFIVLALVMIAAALAFVLPPLLRGEPGDSGVERPEVNLAVLRDERAALDADLARGTIDDTQHEAASAELERRVLEEVTGGGGVPPRTKAAGGRWPVFATAFAVPVLAALLYFQVGDPGALTFRAEQRGEAAISPGEIAQAVESLATRLKENPGDADGWRLLARSYYALGRYAAAAAAYARAEELRQGDAELYADHADALAMSQDRRVDAKVLGLVERALALDPDHPKALVMAATAALGRKDYGAAVGYLERLERMAPPGSQLAQLVGEQLRQARAEPGGQAKGAAAPAPVIDGARAAAVVISGRVLLSSALAGKAAPEDPVFVVARALEGTPMPLAVIKRRVSDLPFEFTLSDAQAMSPQTRLSQFSEVAIVARVSKSGGAAPRSGDLQGTAAPVKPGATGVSVVIDSALP
ncbi:MAG: c-type cytochrome biogenesis protein CcmI [Burkholderiales bacterium]|nr:c-type cytochrome biogenesis protein CcmI [Burkholderiales bacterium]